MPTGEYTLISFHIAIIFFNVSLKYSSQTNVAPYTLSIINRLLILTHTVPLPIILVKCAMVQRTSTYDLSSCNNAIFFPRVILLTFFLFLLIYGGLGVGFLGMRPWIGVMELWIRGWMQIFERLREWKRRWIHQLGLHRDRLCITHYTLSLLL